jgi:hypothetical protein
MDYAAGQLSEGAGLCAGTSGATEWPLTIYILLPSLKPPSFTSTNLRMGMIEIWDCA